MKKGTWVQWVLGLVVAGVAFVVAGCGSGDGNSGGGSGTLTGAQRHAAMDAVNQKLDSLAGLDPITQNQQVLAFMKSRPEFSSAELSANGGAVFATFTSGEPYAVINNLGPQNGRAASTPLAATRAFEIPGSTTARFMNSLGPGYPTSQAQLRTMLAPGYQIIDGGAATVEALKKVNGDGIFYIDGHGLVMKNGITVISTGTVSTDDLDRKTYFNDLSDSKSHPQRLMVLSMPVYSADNKQNSRSVYCITPEFVKEYMHFGANSLVFFNTCESHKQDDLRDACFFAGASLFAGWTAPVESTEANETAQFLFDRLLGANKYQPENPPQRPFYYASIAAQMANQKRPGKDYHLDESDPKWNYYTKVFANLVLDLNPVKGKGDFIELNPAISNFVFSSDNVAKQGLVRLYGVFGSTQGQVTLGGVPLNVRKDKWKSTVIEADLPASVPAADLVVTVNGRKSNAMPVTVWRGTVTVTHQANNGPVTSVTGNLVFPGRAMTTRGASGAAPVLSNDGNGEVSSASPESSATYQVSGHGGNAGFPIYSGGGSFPYDPNWTDNRNTTPKGGFTADMTIDRSRGLMVITFDGVAFDAIISTNKEPPNGKDELYFFETIEVPYSGYTGQGGQKTEDFGNGDKIIYKWSSFTPTNAPTTATARSTLLKR